MTSAPQPQPVQRLLMPGISAKWTALGVTQGFKPVPAHALRIYLIGPMGAGKTVWASSVPNALIIDFDRAQHNVSQSSALRVVPGFSGTGTIDPWDHLKGLLKDLIEDRASTFKTIIFDTFDRWVDVIERGLTNEINARSKGAHYESVTNYGEGGAGWGMIHRELKKTWKSLADVGYGYILIGHLKTSNFTMPDGRTITVPIPSVSEGCSVYARQYADYVGQLLRATASRRVTQTITVGNKVVTNPTSETYESHQIKFRLPTLNPALATLDTVKNRIDIPDPIEFSPTNGWAKFVAAYDRACESAKPKPEDSSHE